MLFTNWVQDYSAFDCLSHGAAKFSTSRVILGLALHRKPGFKCIHFSVHGVQIGYEDGTDRVYLRLPTLLTHVINADSPLASWREAGGLAADGRSEIVVVVSIPSLFSLIRLFSSLLGALCLLRDASIEAFYNASALMCPVLSGVQLNGYMNVSNSNVLRQRTYSVDHHVRYGYVFTPIVKHPALCRDGKSRVRWHHFHDVKPAEGMEKFPPPPPAPAVRPLPSGGPSMTMGSSGQVLSTAPESHANMRSIASVQGPKADGVGLNALAANLARNDYTVLPMDLQR